MGMAMIFLDTPIRQADDASCIAALRGLRHTEASSMSSDWQMASRSLRAFGNFGILRHHGGPVAGKFHFSLTLGVPSCGMIIKLALL